MRSAGRISVNVLAIILHYMLTKYYHWGKVDKGYRVFPVISYKCTETTIISIKI